MPEENGWCPMHNQLQDLPNISAAHLDPSDSSTAESGLTSRATRSARSPPQPDPRPTPHATAPAGAAGQFVPASATGRRT